ncbi:helix-turn-helix domain-containing protein [Lysinibacillus parviboronicapiens]|uniref:helix-turn-helix domain-containing protein n=1 Tax=Lysinibacillus parviboronicapiens TaxID=436516 RepID=UPI000D3A6A41|nr:helix-turn-helix transcriptional regulator [Lysinibacillus parviboronicapiens]
MLEWKLRKVMAEKGIWTGAELARQLERKSGYKLSLPSISALLTEEPKQIKAKTMDALCTTLECTPGDLWEHTPTKAIQEETLNEKTKKVVNAEGFNKLPPL